MLEFITDILKTKLLDELDFILDKLPIRPMYFVEKHNIDKKN